MSSPRARSNQALYYARIVLRSWSTMIAEEEIPAATLHGAFSDPVRAHLRNAYGWFLLELADQGADAEVPGCFDDLAPPATGKAVSPELRELAQLEESGFLSILMHTSATEAAAQRAEPGNLATATILGADYHELHKCAENFEALCERMRNSLDEY
jgi:Family of unknown function (DUF6586)